MRYDSNLAYKDIPESMYLPQKRKRTTKGGQAVGNKTRHSVHPKVKNNVNKANNSNLGDRDAMLHRRITLIRLIYMMVVASSATFMISRFVAVNDTQNTIDSLNRELSNTRAYTSQKIFEMEQSVDLSQVESIATKKLGMQRPEKYQTIYVDVKQDDVTEVTAGDVEGFKNQFAQTMSNLWKNIVGLFSIK